MNKNESILRNPDIFEKKIYRLFIPNALSSSGLVFINLFGAIIAGQVIGEKALAAIAIMSPILLIDEGLHNLLGSSIARIVPKLKVQSGSQAANRFVAATLVYVLLFYTAVVVPLILLRRPIIGIFTTDTVLTEMVLSYYVPIVAAMPFLELLLCLQKAYMSDGNAKLFALRGPITAVSNLLLNFMFVAVFKYGMVGIAFASILSTLLGYIVLLIHRLSPCVSIFPDFSVLANRKECHAYLKMELSIGIVYVPWDIFGVVSRLIVNKILILAGGTTALAIWAVTDNVMSILYTLSIQFNSSYNLVTNVLLGGEDYNVLKHTSKKVSYRLTIMSIVLGAVLFILSGPLCVLFGADEYYLACRLAIRIAVFTTPFLFFSSLVRELLISLGKNFYAQIVSICENVLVLPLMWFLYPLGTNGAILGYYGSLLIAAIVALILVRRKGVIPNDTPDNSNLTSFFFTLSPENNSEVSQLVWQFFQNSSFGHSVSYKTALLIEECCQYVYAAQQLKNGRISMYIRLKVSDGRIRIIFCDNGSAFNLVKELQANHPDEDSLESKIISACAKNMQYERILEMNYLQFSPL